MTLAFSKEIYFHCADGTVIRGDNFLRTGWTAVQVWTFRRAGPALCQRVKRKSLYDHRDIMLNVQLLFVASANMVQETRARSTTGLAEACVDTDDSERRHTGHRRQTSIHY